jgi:hypothetical protein
MKSSPMSRWLLQLIWNTMTGAVLGQGRSPEFFGASDITGNGIGLSLPDEEQIRLSRN